MRALGEIIRMKQEVENFQILLGEMERLMDSMNERFGKMVFREKERTALGVLKERALIVKDRLENVSVDISTDF